MDFLHPPTSVEGNDYRYANAPQIRNLRTLHKRRHHVAAVVGIDFLRGISEVCRSSTGNISLLSSHSEFQSVSC